MKLKHFAFLFCLFFAAGASAGVDVTVQPKDNQGNILVRVAVIDGLPSSSEYFLPILGESHVLFYVSDGDTGMMCSMFDSGGQSVLSKWGALLTGFNQKPGINLQFQITPAGTCRGVQVNQYYK